MKALALAAVSCAELVLAQSATSTASGALPTVDLGYAVHQASSFNVCLDNLPSSLPRKIYCPKKWGASIGLKRSFLKVPEWPSIHISC
jgi:hypothetical protein